jgi:hypothetical protein
MYPTFSNTEGFYILPTKYVLWVSSGFQTKQQLFFQIQ